MRLQSTCRAAGCSSRTSAKASRGRCTAVTAAADGRRDVLTQLAFTAASTALIPVVYPQPAHADLAHDAAKGVVEFWKSRQRQSGGIKLLAPLRVAQRRLQEADQILQQSTSVSDVPIPVDQDTLKDVLQRVRNSSLNCYVFDALPEDTVETRASLLTSKLELSDPCTFRIVLKNVTALEPAAVKQEAVQQMDSLVLSYQKLDDFLEMARDGNPDALSRAQEEIKTTMQVAATIESLVQKVLGV